MNDAERENEIFIKLKLYFEIAITHNGSPSGFFFLDCATNFTMSKISLLHNKLEERSSVIIMEKFLI